MQNKLDNNIYNNFQNYLKLTKFDRQQRTHKDGTTVYGYDDEEYDAFHAGYIAGYYEAVANSTN
jgi:hypothetical protein